MKSKFTRRQFIATVGATASVASIMNTGGAYASTGISEIYGRSDATALAHLVRTGQVTPLELLDEAIRRTEAINPRLNAVTQRLFGMARDYLKREPHLDGPFAGVPFLLKDIGLKLAGTPTTAGSRSLANIKATADSEMVRRFKKAGLVIFGKTNTPEFGMGLTTEPVFSGPTHNPWNREYSTGGSSGGSAAAVSAGIVPMAHGSDAGGSIRVPASACGVFGFKPSRALNPVITGPSGMSVHHVLSRSVRDSATSLDATGGYMPGMQLAAPSPLGVYFKATQWPPKRLRIALNLTNPSYDLDPDVKAAILHCAKTLESLGHHVEEATPDLDYEKLDAAQVTLIMSEFANGMRKLERMLGKPLVPPLIEPLSVKLIDLGKTYNVQQYLDAAAAIQTVAQKMAAFHQKWDIMLQPVTVTPAPKLGTINAWPGDDVVTFANRFRKYAPYAHLQNLIGAPAASLPIALSRNGLPVATMISALMGKDDLVMALSAQLEDALPFLKARPALL